MTGMQPTNTVRIAVDTGGTFTDVAVGKTDGTVLVWKVPSTPDSPDDAVIAGLEGALDAVGAQPTDVERFAHGTTVATNTLLTRSGARVALVTTAGFADVLTIGHQARPSLYDQTVRAAPPLVDPDLTWEVAERTDAHGREVQAPAAADVASLAAEVRAAAPDVVVVSFLNAYSNTAHEDAVADALRDAGAAPSVYAATSVTPEMREYERTSTAVINGYVQPRIARYVEQLEKRLAQLDVPARLWVMQSNGGLLGARAAQTQSVRTILSGLAGGVVGAAHWARQLELDSVVSFDIGGTSTDISLIRDGAPEEMASTDVAGYPLRMPAVEVHTIGAGGGSIAWKDNGGGLRVGPHSAGATPGPVCYGQGGTDITVTDAHLLLGRLGDSLLGGRLALDADHARARLHAFAGDMGLDADDAAAGVLRVITATMARGIRKVSVERGVDPRGCVLMAFGGAGPLHASDLIRELGMRAAVIPPHPGIASAVGMLDAPVRHDFARTVSVTCAQELPAASAVLDELAGHAESVVVSDGAVTPHDVRVDRTVDARYRGQSYELGITWSASFDALREAFDRAHAERYGFCDPDAELEIVTARVTATAETGADHPAPSIRGGADPAPTETRRAYFNGHWHDTPVYRREELPAGCELAGPLIIEQLDSTVVVGDGQRCRNEEHGFLYLMEADT